MTTSSEHIDLSSDELSPSSIDEAWDFDQATIEEGDIRELQPLSGWESDKMTLVGIGPRSRAGGRKPPAKRVVAAAPVSQRMPHSEPPGPFIAEDDEVPPSFRSRKLGIWTVALPSLLVAAAVAVFVLRGMGPGVARGASHAAAVQAPPTENASLVVRVGGAEAHVYLDGQDRGLAPVLLVGLKPGSHALSVSSPGYAPFEQPVTLLADHVSTVEPKLALLPPAEPAAEPKPEPARESAPVHTPGDKLAASSVRPAAPAVAAAAPAPAVTSVTEPILAASPYMGSLSITSSTPVNVVLDGRPLGKAPRVVEVSPGAHTVVFVHPKLGRQSLSVSVGAGKTASAAADF